MRPVRLKLNCPINRSIREIHVFLRVQFWKVDQQLFEHFSKEIAMLILIALNVRDHLACTHHFLIACQIVEEGKSTIEENTFKNQIRYQCLKEGLWSRVIAEILINIRNKSVAFKKNRIMLPIFKNLFLLLIRYQRRKHIRIGLIMNYLLLSDNCSNSFQ
ncbi:hypothetical protein D3C73_573160 [compost metagenome]